MIEKPGNLDKPVFEKGLTEEELQGLNILVRELGKGLLMAGGTIALAATLYNAGIKKYEEHVGAERLAHIESSLAPEEYREYLEITDTLKSEVGQKTMLYLEYGARNAAEKVAETPRPPEFIGFDVTYEHAYDGHYQSIPQFALTEDFKVYPNSWINGQVSKVELKPLNDENKKGGNINWGTFAEASTTEPGSITLYDVRTATEGTMLSGGDIHKILAHEAAHANDWNSRNDLSFIERARLLESVVDRMNSADAYSDNSIAEGDYWRSLEDGSKDGKAAAAREYWAIICAEYFTNPEQFKDTAPRDFALVDTYVKNIDAEFDIFSKERGAFDSYTGEVKEKWKEKVEEIKSKIYVAK